MMKFSEGEMTVDRVTELVSKGFMCSQCVFAHFAPQLGVDEELALQLASPCGGVLPRLETIRGRLSNSFVIRGRRIFLS